MCQRLTAPTRFLTGPAALRFGGFRPFLRFFFRFWCFWCFGVPLITLLMFLCPACSHLLGWGFVKLLRLIFQSILRAKGWLMDFWFRFFGRKGASADWSVDAAVFFPRKV